jgi:hypothetical protein
MPRGFTGNLVGTEWGTILVAGLALTVQAADQTSKYKKLQGDVDAAITEFKKADLGLKEIFKNAAGSPIVCGMRKSPSVRAVWLTLWP